MSAEYASLIDQVQSAYQQKQPLNIIGANTKAFYGGAAHGAPLDMRHNQGIIDYDPAELVIVARTGTPLLEIQNALAEKGQMLGFEPPFAPNGATLGGAVAAGLSGVCRPYRGGVRDYLLGTRIINGKGECLQFGGRVMKNVAGFDLFRPMAGAMGTLGVLLEVSLRVLPIPESEISLSFELADQADAIKAMTSYAKTVRSISAASWFEGRMTVRLSGSLLAVAHDRGVLTQQFELQEADETLWPQLSSFKHTFFTSLPDDNPQQTHIASINLPPATKPQALPGTQLIDWGGARRYLKSTDAISDIRAMIKPLGGSADCITRQADTPYFHPLDSSLLALNKRLKLALDPGNILNRQRFIHEV